MAGERSNNWIVWIRRGGGLDGGGDPGAEGLDVNSMHGGGLLAYFHLLSPPNFRLLEIRENVPPLVSNLWFF